MALWIKKKNNWNEALQRDYFSPRTLKAESIPNGIVLPPKGDAGGVCDSQNKWVAGLTRTTENASFKPGWFGYLKAYSVKKEELIQREESVVFGGILVDHFGHCLIDSLNRSWWFLQNPNDSRKIVFVVATPWGLRGGGGQNGFISQFLTLLGLEKERYEIIESPTQFKEILVPEECAHSWWDYTKEYNLIFDTLIENAKQKAEVPFYPKLYLTRTQWNVGIQVQCVNENVFEDFFQSLGFHVLAPEKFSVAEQILYLNNAQKVACNLGTTSHLALFCRPRTFLTVFNRVCRVFSGPQVLISQARSLSTHIVDATENFLFDNSTYGPVHFVFNENFQNFCRDIWGEEAFLLSQEFALKTKTDDYVRQWAKFYSKPDNFKKIQHLTAFDFVSKMAYELNGEVLDKKKFVPPPPAPKPAPPPKPVSPPPAPKPAPPPKPVSPPPAPPKKKPLSRPPLPYKTRLLNKLKKNPQAFFADSLNPLLRLLGRFCLSPALRPTLGKGLIALTQKFLR